MIFHHTFHQSDIHRLILLSTHYVPALPQRDCYHHMGVVGVVDVAHTDFLAGEHRNCDYYLYLLLGD